MVDASVVELVVRDDDEEEENDEGRDLLPVRGGNRGDDNDAEGDIAAVLREKLIIPMG